MNLVEFQDHHLEGGISLSEYGYALVALVKKPNENAQTSLEHRTPSIKDFNTQEVQRDTIPSRRVLVTDTASKI